MLKNLSFGAAIVGALLLIVGSILFMANNYRVATSVGVLWGIGLALELFFAVYNAQELATFLTGRSARYGLNSIVMSLLVLGVLVVVQLFAISRTWETDLTEGGRFSLSQQTLNVLANLPNTITATAFFGPATEGRQELEDILQLYKNNSFHNFNFEFVDPDIQPQKATQMNVKTYGTVVFSDGLKTEKITGSEGYTEENITNALLKLTKEGETTIYFSKGHGECSISDSDREGLSILKEEIENENYKVTDIELYQHEELPKDCKILAIVGPEKDLLENEQKLIKNFVDGGGRLLVAIDPQESPGMVTFLKDFGFEVGNDMIIDLNPLGQLMGTGPIVPTVRNYEDHPITKSLARLTSIFPLARTVEVTTAAPAGVTAKVIARTESTAWAETDLSVLESGEAPEADEDEQQGSLPIAAVSTIDVKKDLESEGEIPDARVVVFGDSDFMTNSYLSMTGNSNFILNAFEWLAGQENLAAIRPKDKKMSPIFLSTAQKYLILILPIFVMPILILTIGTIVYINRR